MKNIIYSTSTVGIALGEVVHNEFVFVGKVISSLEFPYSPEQASESVSNEFRL